jgi:hypothetical protein
MVSTRTGAGVSKPKAPPKESVEKLKDATNGDLPPAKARVANEQASVRDAKTEGERATDREHSVETQSKPEYDDMEGISHEPLGEQADSSPLDVLDSQLSRSTDDAVPTAVRSDLSRSESSDSDQESELLADFESLRLENGPSGVVDGFGGKGRGAFCILRDGPRNAPIYHFTRTNGFNTQGFKNLSRHRITPLTYENEKEEKNWLYTRDNVEGITGIAVEDRHANTSAVRRGGSKSSGRILSLRTRRYSSNLIRTIPTSVTLPGFQSQTLSDCRPQGSRSQNQ